MTASCVYLWILRSCSDHLRVPLGNILFQVQVAEFQPPDARQCCIQMYFGTVWTIWAPKKLFFYIAMFHVKPKWNIVYKILKKKIFFQETQISFPKCIEHKIFLDTQLQLLGVWGYHLTIQSLTSRRRYALWMHHCREKVFHKCFSSILYKNKK